MGRGGQRWQGGADFGGIGMSDLEILSAFLVDIEDMAKSRGILPFIGISENLGDDIWYVLCNFQIGRKAYCPEQNEEELGSA